MCMKRSTCFDTRARDAKFHLREPSQEMELCSMMCASPNTKVHGVLTMLSLMKPGKKLEVVIGTLFFYCVSHHPLSTAAVPYTNALQYSM